MSDGFGFVLHPEFEETIMQLKTAEEKLAIFNAFFVYARGETPSFNGFPNAQMLWTPIRQRLDRDREEYNKTIEARRKMSEGGKKKHHQTPSTPSVQVEAPSSTLNHLEAPSSTLKLPDKIENQNQNQNQIENQNKGTSNNVQKESIKKSPVNKRSVAYLQKTYPKALDLWQCVRAVYPSPLRRSPSAGILQVINEKQLYLRKDEIVATVKRFIAEDDRWQHGYVPAMAKFFDEERYENEPQQPPKPEIREIQTIRTSKPAIPTFNIDPRETAI